MTNFCPNCGSKLDATDQFCPSCGKPIQSQQTQTQQHPNSGVYINSEILQLLNIKSVAGKWDGRESDAAESTMYRHKGMLLLTNDEFIFVARVGIFSKKFKSIWRIPLSSIRSVKKMPWPISAVFISYNKAPEGAGAFRRFIGTRNLAFDIEEHQSFIAKIKELNPKIQ